MVTGCRTRLDVARLRLHRIICRNHSSEIVLAFNHSHWTGFEMSAPSVVNLDHVISFFFPPPNRIGRSIRLESNGWRPNAKIIQEGRIEYKHLNICG